jgi:HK97 family phage prohead protease
MNLNFIEVPFEIKSVKDDDEFFTFEGMASTFGNIDLVDDMIVKGAFEKSLAERTPVILWQHNTNEPIGMPIEIREQNDGLFLKAKMPKDDDLVKGRVMPQIRIGSVRKMSIGYSVKESDIDGDIRILKQIDLFEISLVTFPANPKASVTGFKQHGKMYSIDDVEHIDNVKDLREFFKQSDVFTKQAREHIINKFVNLGDPGSQKSLSDSGSLLAVQSAFETLNNNLKN